MILQDIQQTDAYCISWSYNGFAVNLQPDIENVVYEKPITAVCEHFNGKIVNDGRQADLHCLKECKRNQET